MPRTGHSLIDPDPAPDPLAETLSRAEIAAALFGWSAERLALFRDEARAASRLTVDEIDRLIRPMSEADSELVHAPGPEPGLSAAGLATLARFQARAAIRSFADDSPGVDPSLHAQIAAGYADADSDLFEPEEVRHDNVDLRTWPLAALAPLYAGEPGAWLRREHEWALGDGRSGYEDLVLQRVREPCVFVVRGGGEPDIADGWHRTAAALARGADAIEAITVSLEPRPDDSPSP